MRRGKTDIEVKAPRGNVHKRVKWMVAAAIFLQAAFLIVTAWAADDRQPVRLAKVGVGGGKVIYLVSVDISGGFAEVTHVKTQNYPVRAKFDTFMGRASATAAINGCYFDMNSGNLVGHVYLNGTRDVEGSFSAAFAVDKQRKAVIDKLANLGDTSKYRTIIACVDILIKDGNVLVKSKQDLIKNGHRPSKNNDIYKPARWSAIGIGTDGKVYLVATPSKMTIYEFAKETREHTAIRDLLGLDGGSSSGLFYEGKVIMRPVRTIPSVIVARPAAIPAYMISRR